MGNWEHAEAVLNPICSAIIVRPPYVQFLQCALRASEAPKNQDQYWPRGADKHVDIAGNENGRTDGRTDRGA